MNSSDFDKTKRELLNKLDLYVEDQRLHLLVLESAANLYQCEDLDKFYMCEKNFYDTLLGFAYRNANVFWDAACPLCGSEGHKPYSKGYSLPIGMERHLTGRGRVQPCIVTNAFRNFVQLKEQLLDSEFFEEQQSKSTVLPTAIPMIHRPLG